jgi:N-acetylglucosamine-6-phosphate deacetylase
MDQIEHAHALRLNGGTVVDGSSRRVADVLLVAGEPITVLNPSEASIDASAINVAGSLVAAGFIETQINGAFGLDFTNDPSSIWDVGRRLVAHGVTSFLPTIISPAARMVAKAQEALAAGPPPLYRGATPLGIHIEGPFISPGRRGTHPIGRLAVPSEVDTSHWTRREGVAMVTLAPEVPGALDLAERLATDDVLVAAGHTAATFETAVLACSRGIRHATHLFNGMMPWGHREPGLAGFYLTSDQVSASLIADGHHSHPSVSGLAWRCLGPERLVLVSDAIVAMGLPAGRYSFGGMDVDSDGVRARGPTGSLAGSVIPLDSVLRRFANFVRSPIDAVLPTVTSNPARILGESRRGSVRQGARGDVVVLEPDGTVQMTFVDGRLAHAARLASPSPTSDTMREKR